VVVKKRSSEIIELAKAVNREVRNIKDKPDREMLVLACYFNMDPELLDAVAISTLGHFESRAGRFVGSRMFGYEKRNGHCITNLGRIESSVIRETCERGIMISSLTVNGMPGESPLMWADLSFLCKCAILLRRCIRIHR